MREHLKDYRDAIIGNGIYDILKSVILFLFWGIIPSTVSNIFIDLVNNKVLDKYRVPISIVLTLIVLFLVLELCRRKNKHRPSSPDVDMPYEIIKKEVTFTYGRERSRYESNLKIKSHVKGLNRIQGKYTWSGSEQASISCATRRCNIIPLIRKDSYIEYEVELPKNYKKNATLECKVIGDMPDPQHTFIPFFSTQITTNTRELVVNICIPPEYGIREIICEEIAIVRNPNDNSKEELLDADGKFTWIIKNPKLFYKYSIRWEL